MQAHRDGTALSNCLRQFLSDVPMAEKHAMPGVGHGIRNSLMRLAQAHYEQHQVAAPASSSMVVDETYLCMTD
eukprot:2527533-Karenia_brevis.AAC.1